MSEGISRLEASATEPEPARNLLGVQLPKRQVLADDVYDIIKASLLANRIPPESRINLDHLARELGVSNTPIRQALARLESEGLVSKQPYRGFVSSPLLNQTAIEELYDLRLMIEPVTAGRAAERRTDAQGRELRATLTTPSVDGNDGTPSGQHDMNFHCQIARVSGNSVVLQHLERILTSMSHFSLYHDRAVAAQAVREHRAILSAIQAGDRSKAQEAMTAHLVASRDRMRHAFQ